MQSSSFRISIEKDDHRTDSTTTAAFEPEPSRKAVVFRSTLFSQNSNIGRKIDEIVRVYSSEVCERPLNPSAADLNDGFQNYRNCLFDCLRFHAEQSGGLESTDINELIRLLREGKSPSDGTAMGGNPLRDCVLAVAMLLKESRAVGVFENDYFVYLKGVAFRVRSNFGSDPAEWWNEFLDFLAGYTHSNGKLKKYQGKSALKFWLRVVLWNFLRRRPIPGGATEFPEDPPMASTEPDELALNESIGVFTDVVRNALLSMAEKDRLLLSMIYIDNLLKKDIAAVFQVHPGQIGRWQETALGNFRSNLMNCLEKLPRKDLYEEIMGGIVNNPKEFSEALVAALQRLRTEEPGGDCNGK